MTRPPRRRVGLPLRAVLPNAVTALGLCAGLSGIRFAIAGWWELAVAMVLLAGVLDGLDGRIARMVRGQSRFGAELDSLADAISSMRRKALGVSTITHNCNDSGAPRSPNAPTKS